MSVILEFIRIFQSDFTEELFTQTACYWFAVILHQRFPSSSIVYNPHQVHFATKINNKIYDIKGEVQDGEDYLEWEDYEYPDQESITECCINLKGGEYR